MSDEALEKDRGMVDTAREVSGIYGLGFERESFLGFILPWAVVLLVGGIGGVLIWKWL